MKLNDFVCNTFVLSHYNIQTSFSLNQCLSKIRVEFFFNTRKNVKVESAFAMLEIDIMLPLNLNSQVCVVEEVWRGENYV